MHEVHHLLRSIAGRQRRRTARRDVSRTAIAHRRSVRQFVRSSAGGRREQLTFRCLTGTNDVRARMSALASVERELRAAVAAEVVAPTTAYLTDMTEARGLSGRAMPWRSHEPQRKWWRSWRGAMRTV